MLHRASLAMPAASNCRRHREDPQFGQCTTGPDLVGNSIVGDEATQAGQTATKGAAVVQAGRETSTGGIHPHQRRMALSCRNRPVPPV